MKTTRWPDIIGLNGYAGAGKNELALMLTLIDPNVREISFAEPLRQIICTLIGCDRHSFDAIKNDPHPMLAGKTPRHAMQTLGTEWGRDMIDPELWIRICMRDVGTINSFGKIAVVSDVRFDNEAQAIRDFGGVIIKIEHTDVGRGYAHASEAGLSSHLIDHIVENDGVSNQMAVQACDWLNGLAPSQRQPTLSVIA